MPIKTLLAASLLLTTAATLPALAQGEEAVMTQIENIQGDAEGFGAAFGQMQDAFLFDDPSSFAELGLYPLQVGANGESYDIVDAQDLVDNFDELLTQETQQVLAAQEFDDLIVSSDGVGFANGALWMANVCLDDACKDTRWGIIAINN